MKYSLGMQGHPHMIAAHKKQVLHSVNEQIMYQESLGCRTPKNMLQINVLLCIFYERE